MNEKVLICYNVHMETRLSGHSAIEQSIISSRSLNIEIDHIHMIMIIPPRYSVSYVIGQTKSQSVSNLREKFPWLFKVYWKESIVWSPGYFVSTVGIDEKSIIKYVQFQQSQDLGQEKLVLF